MGLRLKPGHSMIPVTDGVWIGPQKHGLATELSDDSGVVWSICERLDGTRSRAQIVAEVTAGPGAGSEMTAEDIGEVVDFMVESGWVMETPAPIPAGLSPREVERYERNAQFFACVDLRPESTGYDLQARLKAARITVLGLGGVGSAVATSLAGLGIGALHCVDHDTVELSNLNRQFLCTEADIGRSKVDVCLEQLRARNSDITITGTSIQLDGPGDITPLVKDCDAFLLCADRPQLPERNILLWANAAAYECGVPWLTSGYSGARYSMATYIPGQTACRWCLATDFEERELEMGLQLDRRILPDEGDHPVIGPTAQIAGQFLALEVTRLLLGLPVQTAGRELHRYVIDYDDQYYLEAKSRPDCPIGCGTRLDP